ncbi:MAG TPA: PqiC family protein [Geminicoccaceae bacterium]
MTRDRRHRRHACPAGASLAAALLLAGCAAALPSRLYTLAPASEAAAQDTAGAAGPVLGLGPVELPDYLDRPEIVTRTGDYGVRLGELDKWAEPLEPMFLRLLAERLRRETGSREVVLLPSRREAEPASAVEVEVDRFDAGEGGEVVLDARWRVRQTEGGRTLKAGRSLIRERGTPAPGYDGIVAAMSRAVDGLAREIAVAVPRSRSQQAATRG